MSILAWRNFPTSTLEAMDGRRVRASTMALPMARPSRVADGNHDEIVE